MCRVTRAALVLGTAFLPNFSYGQPVELDPITLRSQEPEKAGERQASDEDLRAGESGGLDDLFRSEPSVNVAGGMTVTERVYVNGIDEEQLAVSIDGAAQNNRMYHHTGTNIVDPGLLKAARVDAGVAGADAGPGALAGAISYETKSALDMLEDGRNFGGKLSTGYTDNGGTATGALTLYGRQGPVDALVYAKRATGDDYDGGDGNPVRFTGADLNSYMVKLGAEANGWRAELGSIRIEDDAQRPYRANFGLDGVPEDLSRRYAMEQTTHSFTLRRTVDDELFNPEFRLSKSESGLYTADNASATDPDPGWNDARAENVSAAIQNEFRMGGVNVTAGIDVNNRKALYEGQFRGEFHRYGEDNHNTGIFAQARGTAGQFDYSAGLRYDWNRLRGAGGQEVKTDGASANASVTWHATDALSFDAGYSSVFGGVPLASVYEIWSNFEAPDAYDALSPTRAQNAILGVNWEQNGATIGAEAFRSTIGNARSGLEVKDVESEGWRLSVGQSWQGGRAVLRYTDTDVTVNGEGATSFDLRALGIVPGRILALDAHHEIRPGMTVGGVVEHTFDEPFQGVDAYGDPRSDWPGYTVVNLYGEYTPARYENLTVRAEVNNLFDEEFVDRASYGGDFTDVIGQQEPGRSIGLTVNITF